MMKDKAEKNISLIDITQDSNKDKKKNHISQIAVRANSKYAPIKDKIEWPFDYEINHIRFDTQNKNKLFFIKDYNDENCSISKN